MNGQHSIDPQIGIWWDDGTKIVAFHHSAAGAEIHATWCDSDYSHNDFWPQAATQFGLDEEAEYSSIPRGRVFWSPAKQFSRLYHGDQTTPDRLLLIAAAFHVSSWKAERDIHYTTGSHLDFLLDDDERSDTSFNASHKSPALGVGAIPHLHCPINGSVSRRRCGSAFSAEKSMPTFSRC